MLFKLLKITSLHLSLSFRMRNPFPKVTLHPQTVSQRFLVSDDFILTFAVWTTSHKTCCSWLVSSLNQFHRVMQVVWVVSVSVWDPGGQPIDATQLNRGGMGNMGPGGNSVLACCFFLGMFPLVYTHWTSLPLPLHEIIFSIGMDGMGFGGMGRMGGMWFIISHTFFFFFFGLFWSIWKGPAGVTGLICIL